MKQLDKKTRSSVIYITLHARDIFKKLRWKDGIKCPYCGETHIWHFANGGYKCSHCHRKFTDTSNTPFHSTKMPLAYWLIAMYLQAIDSGISSQRLSCLLQITQKSAWYMLHSLRDSYSQEATILSGDVAVDEVYLGGKWSSIIMPKKIDILKQYNLWYEGDVRRTWHKKNIRRAISEYKQPVYGMNDGERIVLQALPHRFNSADILDITRTHSDGNIKHLISDQASYYKDILETGMDVIQMNHSKREFRNGDYSSNRIEGTFSHLKRRYRCHYVRPNKKYIQLYLNEFCFRWNNRDADVMDRLASGMALCVTRGRITHKDIDNYSWDKKFAQRKPKRRETLEEWFSIGWPESAYSIEVQGVVYTRKEFEELKAQWEERNNIWYIDESELVF